MGYETRPSVSIVSPALPAVPSPAVQFSSRLRKRVGPLSVSVRKVNLKHKPYDLVLTVDDQQIEKTHVSLYEPIMLTMSDRPQPIELVVNELSDNQVKAYVSDAKYKNRS
jgi:hypothetical protein